MISDDVQGYPFVNGQTTATTQNSNKNPENQKSTTLDEATQMEVAQLAEKAVESQAA